MNVHTTSLKSVLLHIKLEHNQYNPWKKHVLPYIKMSQKLAVDYFTLTHKLMKSLQSILNKPKDSMIKKKKPEEELFTSYSTKTMKATM